MPATPFTDPDLISGHLYATAGRLAQRTGALHNAKISGSEQRLTKVYIAGPMSGYPDHNRWAFDFAEKFLREEGLTPVNPAPYEHPEWEWADYLKRDIPLLLECDGVATLDDWQCSKGASLEVHIAQQLGMPVKPVRAWCL